jgi:hypothetical protein
MKKFTIAILCLIWTVHSSSQVISSTKSSIKFNNSKKETAPIPPAVDQTVTKQAIDQIKPPEINLINIKVRNDTVIAWNADKISLIGILNSNNQKTVLYLNDKEINVNASGFFNIEHSLSPGKNDMSLFAVSENNQITRVVFKIDYQPKVVISVPGTDGKYYAIIIGINNYSDPSINELSRPIKDAEMFYDVITSRYTFDKNNIKLMRDATYAEIVDALDHFAKIIEPADNFLIFYAGHGIWDPSSKIGFWLPSDAEKSSKLAWFRNSTLRDYLLEIKAKHTLLISDACFAGSIFKSRSAFTDAEVAINKLYELPSRKAMTSGTLTQVPDESVFLKYMIDRLRNNLDKYITSEELFNKFRMAVINNSSIVPQFGVIQNVGDEGGDFIFILKE